MFFTKQVRSQSGADFFRLENSFLNKLRFTFNTRLANYKYEFFVKLTGTIDSILCTVYNTIAMIDTIAAKQKIRKRKGC